MSGRRAWGAPPPPRPAAERRAEAVVAEMVEQPAPPAQSSLLPRLGGAVASPRGTRPAALRGRPAPQQQRLKQHAAEQQMPLETSPALPLPLPAVSPEVSLAAVQQPGAPAPTATAAWLPASLHSREDEDAVLIGSTAPSFSLPVVSAVGPLAAARPQPASPLPSRHSFLSMQLGSEDLSLTALAAASRRGTGYSSAGSSTGSASSARSLPSTGGSRSGYSRGASAEPSGPPAVLLPSGPEDASYAPDWEAKSPGAATLPPALAQRPPAQLSSDELAMLRQSLVELDVCGAASMAGTRQAGPPGGGWLEAEIPDAVVLAELSNRLGRLDSQKRRVLLQVLAKIDGMAGAATEPAAGYTTDEEGGAAAAAASQLIAESLGSIRRSSRATSRASAGACSPPPQAPLPESQRGVGQRPAAQPVPIPAVSTVAAKQQQQPAAKAAAQAPPAQQSTSKQGGIMGKLAALRLGRSSSLVGKSGAAAPTDSASAPPAMPAQEQQPTATAQKPSADVAATLAPAPPAALAPPAATTTAPQLQGMVPQRHHRRASRQSTDGSGRQSHLCPQPSLASHPLPSGGDALAAFEQQLAAAVEEEGQPPSLAASPTVLALAAFDHHLPNTLEASRQQNSSSSGGGDFLILCCPSGRVLELRIRTTWGDPHYLGLCALEIFDKNGHPVAIKDPARQVDACPRSINDLPEYSTDPRTPDKLLDGVVLTCDDRHMWLAPFTPGALHTVTVKLDAAATLGAVRVWNYNKSRVGSLRGARHVEMALDGILIFRGELRQAPGSVAEALQHAELVLFTEDPAALAAIEQHDQRHVLRQLSPPSAEPSASFGAAAAAQLDLVIGGATSRGQAERTSTLPVLQPLQPPGRQALGSGGRPLTSAVGPAPSTAMASAAARVSGSCSRASSTTGSCLGGTNLLHCRQLAFVLLESWGDSHFIGMSGLQVLGADCQPLLLAPAQLAADPPDLNVFPGHSGDVRTVDKLVDGTFNTMDDTHMWLAPIKRQLSPTVAAACQRQQQQQQQAGGGGSGGFVDRGALPEAARPYNVLMVRLAPGGTHVAGLLLWNYNKNSSDTARGVKRMIVLADGVEVSPPGGLLVRRAPGTAAFDFGQLIPLRTCWTAAGAGRVGHRSTLQHGVNGRQLTVGSPGGGPSAQQQQLVIHSESLAWACNLPDPAAALEYLQRAMLMAKVAGPGGMLVGQPGENFGAVLPCGFSLRLLLLSSWGDTHYIGLSGLEVRDAVRGPLPVHGGQVFASPASVALLLGLAADVRTPDKLVDGNTSGAPQHSWLAPLDRQEGNVVRLTLDAPVLLGSIRVWNYARTPSRGVQELEVYLDERLVWKGLLQRAPAEVAPGEDFSQTLCFSEEAMQETAAVARRRAAADARMPAMQRTGGGSSRATAAGSLPGAPLGVEGVEEWAQQQERVVLYNQGMYVAFPPDAAAPLPATARPITALVVA